MAESFKLQAIITAVDHLSPTLKGLAKNVGRFRAQLASAGSGGVQMAAGLAAAVLGPAKAFADLENASTQLQNTLMRAGGGVPAAFADISKQAIELGNLLPGSTADFMSMASSLNALGVSAETLSGGALKATAYLGVVGKPLGVTYEQAAESIGKLSNALGIAAGDLVPFADTLQRTLHMGIDLQQMQYSMSRVSGVLKPLKQQGLDVAKSLVPLNALLIQSGVSGEEAGTGLRKIITVMAENGKFKNIPDMVHQLEGMFKNLSGPKALEVAEKLFGKEHASKVLTVAAGGFDALSKKLDEQASITERVNNSLGTLTNLWDAATGTATNAAAAIATAYSPELKQAARWINDAADKTMHWAENNKGMIRGALLAAGGLVGFKLAALAASMALGGLNNVLKMSPLGIAIRVLAAGAPLIIANWEKLGPAFDGIASRVLQSLDRIQIKFDEMVAGALHSVRQLGPLMPDSLNQWSAEQLADIDKRRKVLAPRTQQMSGALNVYFNNAPKGMRIAPPQTSGGLSVTPNVGYRSLGTAAP